MKKGLMNNWGLKILSFLLAVMLWLIVVNIDDPVTTQTFNNIPVAVTNAEVLAATIRLIRLRMARRMSL